MANTPFVTAFNAANGAYAATNAAFNTTNTAFGFANTVNTFAYGVAINATAAFAAANNVGPQIAPAFNTANAAFASANNVAPQVTPSFNTANAAFNTANAAFASANNVSPQVTPAFLTANNAYVTVNSAFASINSNWTTTNAAFAAANTKFSSSGGTISGAVEITADLTVHGNTRFIDQQTLSVGDPLIYLAANNYASDVVDIGFVANYVNATGSNVHTGLYRSSGSKEYYLFYGYDKEPYNNYIDSTGNNIMMAVLNTTVRTSNLILGGANALGTIGASFNTANAAFAAANNVGPQIAPAFNTANAAFNTANADYATTNIAFNTANAAFAVANNVAPQLAPAFNTANAAFSKANNALPLAGGTMTGLIVGKTASGSVYTMNDSGNFSVRGDSTNAAAMSFHRPGAYAINMGLDTDNYFRVGGWSDGSTYRMQLGAPGGTHTFNGYLNASGVSAGSGYAYLFNGVIIQWGNQNVCANCRNLYNFPIAFPSGCYGFAATGDWSDSNGWQVCGGTPANNSQYWLTNVIEGSRQVYWIAMGY